MNTQKSIKKIAIDTIITECQAIKNLVSFIDDDFEKTIEMIYRSNGRFIITGIGKSANIASKIVATLNSTGTPAIFMHAADAIHGDLGYIQKDDIVMCISKSGNTSEVKVLIPLIRNFGNRIIAMVSNVDSFLAKNADFVIRTTIEQEAGPDNLVPTASTTAQLVMGDAIAIALLEYRNFSSEDFARFHPGGSLGKRLYLRVADLLINREPAKVCINDNIQEVILEITSKLVGGTAVIDENNELVGIITDGDIRRMIGRGDDVRHLTASDIMCPSPKNISPEELAINAFSIMKKNKIMQIIVVENEKYLGMIHIHDIIKEGIV